MRNLLLKLSLQLSKKNIFPEYRWLTAHQFDSPEDVARVQLERLQTMLAYAAEHVPYYHDLLREQNVVNLDGTVQLERFYALPALTKDIIREQGDRLYSTDPALESLGTYKNTSGGSTGEPVTFLRNRDTWKAGMAGKWLFYSFVHDYPCKQVKVWGSERDILEGGYGIAGHVKNWIYNRTLLNAFRMSSAQMAAYIETINTVQPDIIEAYVQSIDELATYAADNNITMHSPAGVITSAGNLYADTQQRIEHVFNTKTYNRYGSREIGDMAQNCEKQEGLHVNAFHVVLEILNDQMQPVGPGETGEIYVTTLLNKSMPLIRYHIGDIGVAALHTQCSCGRGLPLIQSIRGRSVNLFTNAAGEKIDGEYFTHLFYHRDWCKQFQVIQEEVNRIVIRIVLNTDSEKGFEQDKKELIDSFNAVMGTECVYEFMFVEEIEPTASGKYLYTISNVSV